MRIAVLLYRWGGGAAIYHQLMIRELQSAGHHVQIVLDHVNPQDIVPEDLPVQYGIRKLAHAYKSADLVITWGLSRTIYDIASRIPNKKMIAIHHGSGSNVWCAKCMKFEAPKASAIVVVSSDGERSIPVNYRHKCVLIPGAISRDRLAAKTHPSEMLARLGIAKEDKTLLYIGRISGEKNLEVALDAARMLPDWKFLIVGHLQYNIDLKYLLGNYGVRLCPGTYDIGDYLQLADCFISPSPDEGFGLSVVEAGIAGIPLVACRTGILCDMPIGNVLPIDATAEQFAKAVQESQTPKRLAQAKQDQQTLRYRFTTEEFKEQWLSLCDIIYHR